MPPDHGDESEIRRESPDRRSILLGGAGMIAASALASGAALVSVGPAAAQVTQEPLGGQPAPGSQRSKVDFSYQIKYQRAFEAVLWSLPAVAVYHGRRATLDVLGLKDNDILAMSGPATPKFENITPNATTPYIVAYTDLKAEPVVVEIPPAGPDGSLYGQVVDAWQFSIADVGMSGIDGGKGGKLLFTGPDFKGEVPQGYIHVKSPNHRIMFAFRSVPGPGKSEQDAYAYSKRLRVYYLSQANNPPEQRFFDAVDKRYPTLALFDESYFQELYETFTYEPVRPQDRHIMGLLASLGIVRGAPYNPDDLTKQAMRQAAIDVWYYLQERLDRLPRDRYVWPDRQYLPLLLTDELRGFSYEYADRIDIDGRAQQFFWCALVPATVSDRPAVYYLMAMGDSEGRPLEAGRTYKVAIPANVPVKQFWSLSIYDRATFAFIYTESNRTTLDSYGLDQMQKNEDGSVTLFVGPVAPAGLESNWIPTGRKRPLPGFRLYGPDEPFFDKTFKMPDFERVD